jgi:hypothetical protein
MPHRTTNHTPNSVHSCPQTGTPKGQGGTPANSSLKSRETRIPSLTSFRYPLLNASTSPLKCTLPNNAFTTVSAFFSASQLSCRYAQLALCSGVAAVGVLVRGALQRVQGEHRVVYALGARAAVFDYEVLAAGHEAGEVGAVVL